MTIIAKLNLVVNYLLGGVERQEYNLTPCDFLTRDSKLGYIRSDHRILSLVVFVSSIYVPLGFGLIFILQDSNLQIEPLMKRQPSSTNMDKSALQSVWPVYLILSYFPSCYTTMTSINNIAVGIANTVLINSNKTAESYHLIVTTKVARLSVHLLRPAWQEDRRLHFQK